MTREFFPETIGELYGLTLEEMAAVLENMKKPRVDAYAVAEEAVRNNCRTDDFWY